ncbi:hypothetical protein QVA72_08820 [Staphylococcus simulans]|uniref:hypothetical protein n=1 Tax=Staphylococcus simulans TaxID=1286 RepID=UPI0028FFE98B|nr:hypothetical protein [Staphylococcus simulans]MDU0420854.1 hypothetical protein [Staphylococcus simulans]MDU0467590.1 hypothetical protein [Staphylococcus simulans]
MRPSYSQFKETVLIEPTSPVVEPFLYYYDKNQHHISGLHISIEVELNNWNVSLENNINTNIITASHTFKVDHAENNVKYHLVVITPETNTAMIIDINQDLRIELSRSSRKYIYDITNYLISGENYIYTAYLSCQLTHHNLQNFKIERIFNECFILKTST